MTGPVFLLVTALSLLLVAQLPQQATAAERRVICYFINWAWYRRDEAKFMPDHIDPNLCTHINYAFAVLDANSLTLKPSDSWADIDNNFFKRVTGLKSRNPNLKVLISLGGWTDSAGDKYSRLVNNPSSRQNFINNVITFLKQHNFDGLDIDWEYPKCWQGDCRGPASDKTNYALWIKELRSAFDRQSPRLLLTSAVVAGRRVIDEAYDVPSLGRDFDFINVMTYDMRGAYDGQTGHHAQFRQRPGDSDPNNNVISSMNYWASKGCPKDKLVMGIPAYGRSFTLSNPSDTRIGAPTRGPGSAGDLTGENGFLGYYEICRRLRNGWTKNRDPNAGPYAYQGDQWVGYDDPQDAAAKGEWVRQNGFGGVMVWDITMDDYKGRCCTVKNPFLTAMNYGLKGSGQSPSSLGCP